MVLKANILFHYLFFCFWLPFWYFSSHPHLVFVIMNLSHFLFGHNLLNLFHRLCSSLNCFSTIKIPLHSNLISENRYFLFCFPLTFLIVKFLFRTIPWFCKLVSFDPFSRHNLLDNVFLFFHSYINIFIHLRKWFDFIMNTLLWLKLLDKIFVALIVPIINIISDFLAFFHQFLPFFIINPKPRNLYFTLFLFIKFSNELKLTILKFF